MSMISISVAKSPASAFWKTRADLRSCWSISPGYSDAAVSHSKVSRKHVFHLYPIHITSISYSYHINILFISCNKPIFFHTSKIGGTLEGWKTVHFCWIWGPSRSMMIYGLRGHESPRTSASASYFAAPAGRLRRQTACKAGWKIPTGLTPWAGTVLSRWGQYPRVRWTSWEIWWFSGNLVMIHDNWVYLKVFGNPNLRWMVVIFAANVMVILGLPSGYLT